MYDPECPILSKTIGQHIRKHRIITQATFKLLTRRLDAPMTKIRAWEGDRLVPQRDELRRVIAWLGYNPCYESS